MREIKFRAWDEWTQKMHYTNLHKTVWAGGKEVSVNTDEGKLEGGFIGMQFTGLKDVKNKEIYEGDIILYNNYGKKGIIVWEEETAKFVCDRVWRDFSYHQTEIEVIGNIYENESLLEEKK